MTIRYKIVKTATPGVKGGGKYHYYPRIYDRKKIDLEELSERISRMSSLHEVDVMGVLMALTSELPELLLNNHTIQLGEFGTFSLHASGTPSDTPKEVNAGKIKGVKVAFRPGKRIKRKLRNAKFSVRKI
ncbi:MAG: HU family DNA-binding protein [Prolixibacteraceae bacterium]